MLKKSNAFAFRTLADTNFWKDEHERIFKSIRFVLQDGKYFEEDATPMAQIDRKWANNQLRHSRNSAILTLTSMHLMQVGAVEAIEKEVIVIKPDALIFSASPEDRQGKQFELELSQLGDEFRNHRSRLTESLEEWWKFVRRNLCKESFEITKVYANANNVFEQLQKMPWYPYARTIRNAISHDFHFRFHPKDLAKLPISWDGHTIDSSMDGKDMTNNLLDPHMVWTLHNEMVAFVNSN